MSLSTHVLDAVRGGPAVGMAVRWESRDAAGTWAPAATGVTDTDGRIAADAWRPTGGHAPAVPGAPAAGRHRLVFDVESWATSEAFFPEVTITFAVGQNAAGERHHVPLLLSPYAYTTYRGS